MRLLLICAFLSTACSATIEARRPLTAEQIGRLRSATGSRAAEVESVPAGGAPRVLKLTDIEFAPDFLRGTASDGVHTIPLTDVVTVSWRDRGAGAAIGLLAGPFAGALIGLGIGASLSHSCGPGCVDSEAQAINMIAGVTIGALTGLILGPVVGALVGRERRIEFAPQAPQPAPIPTDSETPGRIPALLPDPSQGGLWLGFLDGADGVERQGARDGDALLLPRGPGRGCGARLPPADHAGRSFVVLREWRVPHAAW